MTAIGVIDLTASFLVYRHTERFVQSAGHAQGTVIKMVKADVRDADGARSPVYTFQDSAGKQHEIRSSAFRYPPAYQVGDTIPVIYQPDQPEKAKIDSFFEVWLFPLMAAGSGCVELVVALVLWTTVFMLRRAGRRPPAIPASR